MTPHRVSVIQLRRLQRVFGITVQCKTREPKREPREGTDLSGPCRVNEFGNYAKARITTRCVDKVDNSRILTRCDFDATPRWLRGRFPHQSSPIASGQG